MNCFVDGAAHANETRCGPRSRVCRKPFAFPPGASTVRGAALREPGSLPPDGGFVEVAHTSRCGAGDGCTRGFWLYKSSGCTGVLFNVGRSHRALNKLSALSHLAGASATCSIVHAELASRSAMYLKKQPPRTRAWFARIASPRLGPGACLEYVANLSSPEYALLLPH